MTATRCSPWTCRRRSTLPGSAVQAPCARLYLVEDGKIKTEQVMFYVSQG
jgi:hypothetical protein